MGVTHILNILKLPTEWWRILSLFGLSVFFVYFGIDHFINPDFYLSIMPPAFPLHAEAVYISGFFEILGGICVLIPSLRKLAGWGLIALLVSVYPANIYMAINPEAFPEISIGLLYFRLPLQFLFIYWAYSITRPVYIIK
ncbi:MAG: membrane protein [Gammaproteobacteria bacterium]|nr:MAG: membrane protein [Gammaproteobacteria bacterium]